MPCIWDLAGGPRAEVTCPVEGSVMAPRPHSYSQMDASRIQDPTCSIQGAGIKGYQCKDTRMHRMQDTGYSKRFAAWWPLFEGPADDRKRSDMV